HRAGQLVELIGLDASDAVHRDACRTRNLLHAHVEVLAMTAQIVTDGLHRLRKLAEQGAAFSSSVRPLIKLNTPLEIHAAVLGAAELKERSGPTRVRLLQ